MEEVVIVSAVRTPVGTFGGSLSPLPATDLGIVKALTRNGKAPSKKQILDMAEHWRPYRSYAALCLWNYGRKQTNELYKI